MRPFLFSIEAMEYAELLKHPFWQKKRLEIFQRDNFTCRKCGDTLSNLQLHHSYYKDDTMPWDYPDHVFTTLCELCHEKEHFYKWFSRVAIPALHKEGFIGFDIKEINELVKSKIERSHSYTEVRRYMRDIKKLING
jgi:hypothetical protein